MVRLQTGNQILAAPIYLPEDTAIPAPEVPARAAFTRAFVSDHQVLQREQKQDVPGWLTTVAPARRAGDRAFAARHDRLGRRTDRPSAAAGAPPRSSAQPSH